jgi:hypothetical protein
MVALMVVYLVESLVALMVLQMVVMMVVDLDRMMVDWLVANWVC